MWAVEQSKFFFSLFFDSRAETLEGMKTATRVTQLRETFSGAHQSWPRENVENVISRRRDQIRRGSFIFSSEVIESNAGSRLSLAPKSLVSSFARRSALYHKKNALDQARRNVERWLEEVKTKATGDGDGMRGM